MPDPTVQANTDAMLSVFWFRKKRKRVAQRRQEVQTRQARQKLASGGYEWDFAFPPGVVSKNVSLPVVLLGDFNAHSDLWGSHHLDERGAAIEGFVSEHGLMVLNNGAHTRIDFHDGHTSAIDLSIVSESLARRLTWEVSVDCCGSDHFLLIIRDRERNSRPDWKTFEETLNPPDTVNEEALES